MSDTAEKLLLQLHATQHALAAAQARCERHDAAFRVTSKELEDNRNALLFTLEDLEAARKQIEQAHQEWVAALDVVEDPIFLHDRQFRILRCNKAYQQCAGLKFKEIIGQPYYDIFPKTGQPAACCLQVLKVSGDASAEEEITVGEIIYRLRVFSIHDEEGGYLHSVHILENITERKRVSSLLRESQTLTQNVVDSSNSLIYALDRDGKFILANRRLIGLFNIRPDQLIGRGRESVLPGEIADEHRNNDLEVMNSGMAAEFEESNIEEDGSHVYLSQKFPLTNSDGQIYGVCGISTDITERKQAEISLNHANRALATLSSVNHNMVHADNESDLLQSVCVSIVEQRGYRLAWVGYVQHDEVRSIKIMAHAGFDEGYLDDMRFSWADAVYGAGPSGHAIRSGVTHLCQDIASDAECLPWRDAALQHGYAASIALPLISWNGGVFGILNVYADEANAFSPGEISLLEEMAGDLAFGVRTLRVREERDFALVQNQQHVRQLQDSLENTVRAIGTIVEMRDPYTAGHETRVADLAGAIAGKLGLPDEQAHAIHLAGVVHDLGKIRIPAEILSKPGRLDELEYSLIKIHSQAGYDILKGINFPWPIAQMVLQHHERLDGSGYPQALKGDDILLEARILSVADVVEAIFSHRPYRPGLGINAALDEIMRGRGTHFDPQVVDACVALFREQGYAFSR